MPQAVRDSISIGVNMLWEAMNMELDDHTNVDKNSRTHTRTSGADIGAGLCDKTQEPTTLGHSSNRIWICI